MRLERLEINGFKSFSDRSELSFDRVQLAIDVADANIVEVHERASSLEDVYFDVMGVRPGVGGEVE